MSASPPPGPPDARYVVDCPACQAPFDAVSAPWCSCLSTERTLVCPACKECACHAPRAWKQAFWGSAPEALWCARRNLASAALRANAPPAEVRRPLVLVVDDEPAIVRLAVRAVESLGCG